MINRIGQMIFTLILMAALLAGCTIIEDRTQKIKDIEFTVVPEQEIPEDLLLQIRQRQDNVFKMTYADEDYLYICVGYGAQETGGYSVTVDELYLTANAIYINTSLLAPQEKISRKGMASYPYICVKMEYIDKTVVFE